MEVRVTWEPGDAARLTAEAVAEGDQGKIDRIVAGGGDGTINEVFAAAYAAGLSGECALGILPLGTANDFAHSTGVPVNDLTAALLLAATGRRGDGSTWASSMTGYSSILSRADLARA